MLRLQVREPAREGARAACAARGGAHPRRGAALHLLRRPRRPLGRRPQEQGDTLHRQPRRELARAPPRQGGKIIVLIAN